MNEKEKNASIDYILSRGLVKPQSAWTQIAEMYRAIGLRSIFWDTGYSLFFTAVTLAVVLVVFAVTPENLRYSAAVAVAPLMFLLITLFAETSERACGLYGLKQTCRYTIRQIAALRAVCYSVAGVAFTAVIAAISAKGVYEFFSIFPLCLSALFICAALSLSVARFSRGKWAYAAYSAVWVFASIALPFSLDEKWEQFLAGVPVALSVVIVIIGMAVLAYQISKILSEVDHYAVA